MNNQAIKKIYRQKDVTKIQNKINNLGLELEEVNPKELTYV